MIPFILAAAAIHGASAIPHFPQATVGLAQPAIEGFSPAPTGKAKPGNFLELFKRAAAPNTCGYINASSSRSVTCIDAGYVCATNPDGGFGCCAASDLAGCYIATGCVPYASSALCDSVCQSNLYLTKCGPAAPSCQFNIYVLATTQMTYNGCAAVGTVITVYPTYTDGLSSPTSSVVYIPVAVSTSIQIITAPTSIVPYTTPPSTTSHTTSTTTPALVTNPTPKPKPIGAIVGGVIGGFAVIATIVFGIFFFLARKKKQENPPAPAPAPEVGGAAAGYYYQEPKNDAVPMHQYQPQPDNTQPKYQGHYGSPPSSPPPVSPAPAYAENFPNNQPSTNMIDGRQVWPTRPGAYEVQG